MNKEQQALDELRDLVHSELDGTRMLDEYLKHCDTLQELVDKATPKKVDKYSRHKDLEPTYFCPKCENIVEKEQKHCPECGQRLE